MLDIRPSTSDDAALDAYGALFSTCFPDARHLGPEYLAWLYADNPEGGVVGFDAWSGDRLAAHYACIPAMATVDGTPQRVLLSLNTATHPDFQGQGLFTRLAEATYQHAAGLGYAMVYGVANDNSTPGFIRKLGFEAAGALDARIGVGRVDGRPVHLAQREASFARRWSRDSLAWRVSNPMREWHAQSFEGGALGCWTKTGSPGIAAWSELPAPESWGMPARRCPGLHLHLGLRPVGSRSAGLWIDVPKRFRRSPLNLIFKPLVSGIKVPERDGIFFGTIDFDAF